MAVFTLINGIQRTLFTGLLLVFCLTLGACREEAIAPGVVASVNGEPVFFREMEARRVNFFSAFASDTQGVEDALLQEQYRYVLGRIIAEEIVWQYMDGKGVTLTKEELLEEEQRIRSDYPEGAFENMIMEEAVTLGFWRKGIARRLMVDKFIMQILRPEISITADEVQQYYRAHKEEFVISEQWHFIQILGKDQKEVEQASKHLSEGKNATATQKEFLVTIHDICLSVDMLPQEQVLELSQLAPWGASKIKKINEDYRTLVLVENIPSTMLDAAEVSKRVEQALLEEKSSAVYTAWLKKRLGKTKVLVAPLLFNPLPAKMPESLAPVTNGKTTPVPEAEMPQSAS